MIDSHTHLFFKGILVAGLATTACGEDAAPASDLPARWTALKSAWAADHLKLAEACLEMRCPGFADAQAGLAAQLLEADAPALQAYEARRQGLPEIRKGWLEADSKAYEAKRLILHRRHAEEAAGWLKRPGAEGPLAGEVEAWALRLDPDQAGIRGRRREGRAGPLGWLPAEEAARLREGLVLFRDRWEKPEAGAHASWREAYEIPTEHFRIRTALRNPEARGIAADMETLHRLWEEILEGVGPLGPARPPPVLWILEDRPDYAACVEACLPSCAGVTRIQGVEGFSWRAFAEGGARFDPASYQAFFYRKMLAPKQSCRSVMLHEVSHLTHFGLEDAHRSSAWAGMWCYEGLAMLMEGLHQAKKVDWNGIASLGGHPRREALQALSFSEALLDMPLSDFQREMVRTDGAPYSQSLALCHFLMFAEGGRYRRGALRYLIAQLPGDAGDEAFEACFPGLERAAFLAKTQAYLKALDP